MIKIFGQDSIKNQLSVQNDRILANKIGMDIGQSLTKIAYVEGNELILTLFSTKPEFKEINNFLTSNKKKFTQLNLSGGKAYKIYEDYSKILQTNVPLGCNIFSATINARSQSHRLLD